MRDFNKQKYIEAISLRIFEIQDLKEALTQEETSLRNKLKLLDTYSDRIIPDRIFFVG